MRTRRRLRGAFLLVWGLLWAVGVAAAGDQTAADKAALDKLLFDALKDMHNRAADVYNAGDANGAYRMFQGGLLMAKPLLAHRPEAQQIIDQGMQNADRQASIPQRRKMLHETIEAIRTQLKPPAPPSTPEPPKADKSAAVPIPQSPPPLLPSTLPIDPTGNGSSPTPPPVVTPAGVPPPAPAAQTKTLWDRLGGETNVAKIVDDLITLILDDKTIDFTRGGGFPLDRQKEEVLKRRLIDFLSELSSGTLLYTGKGMAEAHQGMNIQGKQFDNFVATLRIAVKKNSVADKDVDELIEKVNATRKDIVK